MIKVLIVDDHAIVRQGLRRILEEAKEIKLVGEASNGIEALKRIRSENWDVVLLDISMPEKNGIDTLKLIMDENKAAKVLILSMYPENQYAVRLMKAGRLRLLIARSESSLRSRKKYISVFKISRICSIRYPSTRQPRARLRKRMVVSFS